MKTVKSEWEAAVTDEAKLQWALKWADLQGTTDEGPNTVPAPHPNLRKKG